MRHALYDQAKRAVEEYPRGREESIRREKWLWDYPAQVNSGLPASLRKLRERALSGAFVSPETIQGSVAVA